MEKDYICTQEKLISLLEHFYQEEEVVYDLLWLVLAYGISLQDLTTLQNKHISEDYVCHVDGRSLVVCNHLLLQYLPPCISRKGQDGEDYLIYSRRTKKYKPGSSASRLTRTRMSTLLNDALKTYRSHFKAETLRKTYVFFFLQKYHTLVGSSYEYLQFRHKRIQELLSLSEAEYETLITENKELSSELSHLRQQFLESFSRADVLLQEPNHSLYETTRAFVYDCSVLIEQYLNVLQNN